MRRDDEQPAVRDTASNKADEVERAGVRPVNVLEHENGWLRVKPLEDQAEEVTVWFGTVEGLQNVVAESGSNLEHGSQRCGRDERIAAAGKHPNAWTKLLPEQRDDGRLSRTGLTLDEQERTGSDFGRPPGLYQLFKQFTPL